MQVFKELARIIEIMNKKVYERAKAIMEERDKIIDEVCRVGETIANIDRENPDSITEFVKALVSVENDHQVLWNIIDKACEPMMKRAEELEREVESFDEKEPLGFIELEKQKLRISRLIDEIESLIGYKIKHVDVKPKEGVMTMRNILIEIVL